MKDGAGGPHEPGLATSGELSLRVPVRHPVRADSDGDGQEPRQLPPVVGIGASAGGLESLVQLLGHLAPDTGLAYVVVQHLDPVHKSLLPEILGRAGTIPVIGAADGVKLAADHVYVIPPNATMTVTDGHLRVVQAKRRTGVHTVIDEFLRSLAEVHRDDAIGVILSGLGSDGSKGIEAIKELGGITLAQEPASAPFPSMPESAIATGSVDFVLNTQQIAEQLLLIATQLSARPGTAAQQDDADVEKILIMLRSRTGADFRAYRRATVQRRILRRMLAHRSATRAEYLEHLRQHPEDLDVLCEDLLIGVTRFFRDPETFVALHDVGFPEMMKGRPSDAPVRAWVAGCSTGEEAYSVAIALIQYLEADGKGDVPIHVFATDLNEAAITKARHALYPESIEADVSPARLARFFVKEDGGYRVTRRVREMCVFATQNIVRDPPFSQLDLITCRNVLIYFQASLQERVIPMFNYALKPNGLLLLGAAESVGSSTEYFAPLDKHHRIFRRQANAHRVVEMAFGSGTFSPLRPALVKDHLLERPTADAVRSDADRAVLERFGPPGVVINEQMEITQFRGDTTGFVQHTSGVASLHLFKLVRAELLPRVREAIETARTTGKPAREERIALRDEDVVREVAVEVIPLTAARNGQRHFVVLFDAPPRAVVALMPARRGRGRAVAEDGSHAREVTELRGELAEAKRFLQDVIEQYEGSNEELRAANEEIQSSNEELQSTSEELETTKEEVQSTNEELTTVNEELRHRNRELAAASADLSNVFASTQIPILIVDGTLCVRRFTPVTERVVKLIPTDIGRPLADLRLRISLNDLEPRIVSAIDTLVPGQVDVQDDLGRWWSLTIRPYLTLDKKVDGAVLVFTDIDAAKRYGQQAELTSETRRMLLVDAEAARAEAAAANLAKSSFLANISHDLRTPLNAITGYADLMELLVHGPITPEQEKDLARIKRSSRYLLSLINDILNFVKVDNSAADMDIAPLPLEPVFASLEAMVDPQVSAKGLRFEHTVCDAQIMADAEKLQQILLNLMTNAIKFTTSGGISVACHCNDRTVFMDVTDTGIGIPADQLERIFEPFIQVSRNLTHVNNDGVGLGLAISRTLARAMGGDLTVRSTLGKGSTFTLSLPRAI